MAVLPPTIHSHKFAIAPVAQSFRLQFCHVPCTDRLHDPLTSHGTFRLCKGSASSKSLLSGQRLRLAPYFKLMPEASSRLRALHACPAPCKAAAMLQQASAKPPLRSQSLVHFIVGCFRDSVVRILPIILASVLKCISKEIVKIWI